MPMIPAISSNSFIHGSSAIAINHRTFAKKHNTPRICRSAFELFHKTPASPLIKMKKTPIAMYPQR